MFGLFETKYRIAKYYCKSLKKEQYSLQAQDPGCPRYSICNYDTYEEAYESMLDSKGGDREEQEIVYQD